eukprot:m.166263 g.166263  ORF g.166263 m.166263 type:complete len:990 (-) comp17750_c0_seq11:125-3094(-)
MRATVELRELQEHEQQTVNDTSAASGSLVISLDMSAADEGEGVEAVAPKVDVSETTEQGPGSVTALLATIRRHVIPLFRGLPDEFSSPTFFDPELDGSDCDTLIENIIVAALTAWTDIPSKLRQRDAFAYLVDVYNQAAVEHSRLFTKHKEKAAVVQSLQQHLITYARFVLLNPDVFVLPVGPVTAPKDCVLARFDLGSDAFPRDVLPRLTDAMSPTERKQVFEGVLGQLNTNMRGQDQFDSFYKCVSPLVQLCQSRSIATLVIEHPSFVPKEPTCATSLLGPFFAPSVFPLERSNALKVYFPNVDGLHQTPHTLSSTASLRASVASLHQFLDKLVRSLLQVKEQRPRVLDFFKRTIALNDKRSQFQHVHSPLWAPFAEDGLMTNMFAVLLRLCEPFAKDPHNVDTFAKIDEGYLIRPGCWFDLSDETRLATPADNVEAATASWLQEHPEADEQHFVSNVFYMTLTSLHVGFVATLRKFHIRVHERYAGIVPQLQRAHRSSPQPMAFWSNPQTQQLTRVVLLYNALVLDSGLLDRVLVFLAFTCSWLLHMMENAVDNQQAAYKLLPEFIFEDLTEVLLHIARHDRGILDRCAYISTFVRFAVKIIGDHDLNPHFRSNFVEILARFSTDFGHTEDSRFLRSFDTEPVSLQQFCPSLVRFYIDIEEDDVYARYQRRYNVAVLLKILWRVKGHRESFLQSTQSSEFSRFIMLLINDTTYLMDEAWELFSTVHNGQATVASPEFAQRPQQEQQSARSQLSQQTGTAKFYVSTAMANLEMFVRLSKDIVEPFLAPELIDRLAAMLNYTLAKVLTLPFPMAFYEGLEFRPIELAKQLAEIYVQLSCVLATAPQQAFVDAVAHEERSFEDDLLERLAFVLQQDRALSSELVGAVRSLVSLCSASLQQHKATSVNLGDDIPEEFLDPILWTLMRDPVMLPASRQVVDRATIATHLLSDPMDPFNRAPLTIDQVVPVPDLRQRIEEWIAERTAAAAES